MFEFVDHTALDDLERFPSGADENYVKKIMWQVLKGVEFCHVLNVRVLLLKYIYELIIVKRLCLGASVLLYLHTVCRACTVKYVTINGKEPISSQK